MKNLSIRLKITLWFSAILVAIVSLTAGAILYVGGSVMQKTIKDNLIETIENNVDEVEFFSEIKDAQNDNDADHYIEYNGGFLEVDDDYLDVVNGISTSLYLEDGMLLYGENPVARNTADKGFFDGKIQKVSVNGVTYYLYDRMLTHEGVSGLWLRGVVSEQQGAMQLSRMIQISLCLLPVLLLLAITGGYFIAGRSLRPIRNIEDAAAQISKGRDLKKRIELSPGSDELHQLAQTFNEMFERLESAFESERQFASDVSHELRTPMSVIMAQCEFSLEQIRSQEEYETALKMIQRQGGKMSRLIEDMLRFVRIERKSDTFAKETVDLSKIVSSVCQDMALLKDRGILLTSEVESGILVEGNRELLSRVLTNLISNAYRYGRENGYIKVALVSREKDAVLTVSDNGIGIAPEQQSKIFSRFYQVEPSRSSAGTGLGLAMVQEIAHFHGGEISVESEPDKGSIFTLNLRML